MEWVKANKRSIYLSIYFELQGEEQLCQSEKRVLFTLKKLLLRYLKNNYYAVCTLTDTPSQSESLLQLPMHTALEKKGS